MPGETSPLRGQSSDGTYDRAERVRRGLERPDGTVLALTAEEARREDVWAEAFFNARARGLSDRASREVARAALRAER